MMPMLLKLPILLRNQLVAVNPAELKLYKQLIWKNQVATMLMLSKLPILLRKQLIAVKPVEPKLLQLKQKVPVVQKKLKLTAE